MKKINIFLGITSTILISSFVFGSSNSLNPNLNNNTRYLNEETHVSTYEELYDVLNSGSDDIIVVFDNDIDLSNFNPDSVLFSLSDQNWNNFSFTIDGNGHGFVNKPSEYYFTSIFDSLQTNYNSKNVTFKNLTLDNVGSFINQVRIVGSEDYSYYQQDPSEVDLTGKGLTFQNITIKNNIKENETFYLEPFLSVKDGIYLDADMNNSNQSISLLVNNIIINNGFFQEYDAAVTFSNIIIENNHIDNNTFNIVNDNGSISNINYSISESFLSNVFFIDLDSTKEDNTFLTYEYIYIQNNSFINNTFKIGNYLDNEFIFEDFDDSIYEAFGNISGNFNIVNSNNTHAGKNYLMIHDIYVSANSISESKKENTDGSLILDKYQYSELISSANNIHELDYLWIENYNDIFIFNNESYQLNENGEYEFANHEDVNLININLNLKDNHWENLNSNNFFVYGPMYDSSKDLNLFSDLTVNSSNDIINYGRYLFKDTEEYIELIDLLIDNFGIYGYQIEFLNIEEDGQTRKAINSISKVKEEHIDIFYDNLVYKDKDSAIISKIELSFKYYQPFDETGIIDSAYQISNLKLYNDQNEDQNLTSDEVIASSNDTYNIEDELYNVSLDLENELKLTQQFIDNLDLNNLYLGFDYSNDSSQKVSSSTILKINPDQLKLNFEGILLNENNIILIAGSVIASILFIILVILLILLIIWLLKRKRINNTSEVQDGYYEYSEDDNLLDN